MTRNERLWPAVEAGHGETWGFALQSSLKPKVSYWPKVWRIFLRGGFLPFPQQPSRQFSASSPFLQHFSLPWRRGKEAGGWVALRCPSENDDPGSCLLTSLQRFIICKTGMAHLPQGTVTESTHMDVRASPLQAWGK